MVNVDSRIASFLSGGRLVVDIGCGAGNVLDVLGHCYEVAVGMDISTLRLKQRKLPVKGWHFVQSNLNDCFPLRSGSADAVFANQVIEHISDPLFFAREIYRICRLGGVAVITTPNSRYLKHIWRLLVLGKGIQTAGGNTIDGAWDHGHIHYFTHQDLYNVFKSAGFSYVFSRGLIDLRQVGWARYVLDRFSTIASVREFLSGNMLLIARK